MFVIHAGSGFGKLVECLDHLARFRGGHVEKSAPDVCRGEAAGNKGRHNTKVVGTAFERAPEPGVGRLGRGGNGAVGQHDLVAEDIVAHETDAGREEG